MHSTSWRPWAFVCLLLSSVLFSRARRLYVLGFYVPWVSDYFCQDGNRNFREADWFESLKATASQWPQTSPNFSFLQQNSGLCGRQHQHSGGGGGWGFRLGGGGSDFSILPTAVYIAL